MDQSQSTDAIGFRCAMDRVGDPISNKKNNQRRSGDTNKSSRYFSKKNQ